MSTPTEHFRGMEIPGLATPANLPGILTRFADRAGTIVEVDSRVEADQVLADAQAAGVTGTALYVWQTDIKQLLRHPNTGATGEYWDAVGGRGHGATISMTASTLRQASEKEWDALYADTFVRASDGWTLTPDGIGVIVPATGLYLARLDGMVSGDRFIGRTLVDLVINSATRKYGVPTTDENRTGQGYGPMALTNADQLKIEVSHSTGGTRGFTGELTITQLTPPPRWRS